MEEKTRATEAAPIQHKNSDIQPNMQGNTDILSEMKAEMDAVKQEIDSNADALNNGISLEIMNIIRDSTLDLTKENPDPIPLLFCGGQVYATRGNFSVIVGLPGSRKSFFATMMVGAYLNGENGVFSAPNGSGKVLWIDTEQADGHVARIGRRINKICGLPEAENNPDIHFLMLREYDEHTRKEVFKAAMKLYNPDFVMLDGAADLMLDPNNVEQSAEIKQLLMQTSKEYDCHIATVLHCNVGSEKARGHVGSDFKRKAETEVLISADDAISTVKFTKARDIRPDNFSFWVQDGLPVTCNIPIIKKNAEDKRTMFASILSDGEIVSRGVLEDRVVKYRLENGGKGASVSNAKLLVTNAVKDGVVIKNNAGGYALRHRDSDGEGEDSALPF